MKTRLAVLTIVWCGVAIAQGTKQQAAWKEYVYSEDGFALSAPSALSLRDDPQASGVRLYSVQLDQTARFLIRTSNMQMNCREKFERMKKEDNPSRLSSKEISLQGNPGLEAESKDPRGNMLVERFYCLKDRVFVLTAKYPFGKTRPAVIDRAFSSFRLLEPKAR